MKATDTGLNPRFIVHKWENLPWFTVKIDLIGFKRKAIQIIIVQTDIEEPVIQNMKRVMKIWLEGDFANSQAFYMDVLILWWSLIREISYIFHDLNLGEIFLSTWSFHCDITYTALVAEGSSERLFFPELIKVKSPLLFSRCMILGLLMLLLLRHFIIYNQIPNSI